MMDDREYHFKVYSTPITFPLSFAVHTWIFVNSPEYGPHRYDVFCFKNPETKNYLYINSVPEKQGMSVLGFLNYFHSKSRFNSTCLYEITGDQAKEVVLKVEESIKNYPDFGEYILYPGPNSNTFTKWIIEKAGLSNEVQLPWNAFGKLFHDIF